MRIACDCHVHVYPKHNLAKLLEHAWNNLQDIAPDSEIKVLCLTERFDCHFFKNAAQELCSLPEITFEQGSDWLKVSFKNKTLYILPGRQIITAERLELLALTKDVTTPDGLSYQQAFADIQQQGALSVINWAPGKWFFKRGALISKIIDSATTGSLLFCDTTLRCKGWPEPNLMRKAKSKGFKIIAGSDPLPIAEEEQRAGSYAILADVDFDEKNPGESLRLMLSNAPREIIGQRNNPLTMLRRINTHNKGRK